MTEVTVAESSQVQQAPKADEEFTIYWRHGERSVIRGGSIEDAFTKAGYGAGAVAAVDWYDRGDTNTHEWVKEIKTWMRRQPIISQRH